MPHTILYVEDESAIIELVQYVLAHPNIRLISALNGGEGLKKAREIRPDLIILDVMIPDQSGWSIYHELRLDDELKDTPIIMLTGQLHRYWIMKEFAKSAIDAYITKPFDASAIRNEVETMLGTTFWSVASPKPHATSSAHKPRSSRRRKKQA